VELPKRKTEDRPRLGIGYVPQGRQHENPRPHLRTFPVLQEIKHRRGGDLSGGRQQQLAIGRVLVIEPRPLTLDEPGEGIHLNIVAKIGEVIRRYLTV